MPDRRVALLLISDGREEYLERCERSIREMVPAVDYFIRVDDADHRLGFAGAIQEGWQRVLRTDAQLVFHVEQDFVFQRPVPLRDMAAVLAAQPHLVQLALLRQAVNDIERAAGGVIEQHPDSYVLVHDELGRCWREHRRYFTTNPSLYPRWIVERGWPSGRSSEGRFGIDLFAGDAELRAAYWDQGIWVEHIGDHRAGTGY